MNLDIAFTTCLDHATPVPERRRGAVVQIEQRYIQASETPIRSDARLLRSLPTHPPTALRNAATMMAAVVDHLSVAALLRVNDEDEALIEGLTSRNRPQAGTRRRLAPSPR